MTEARITDADIDAAYEDKAAWALAEAIVLGNHGVGNAAVLIHRALAAHRMAEREQAKAEERAAVVKWLREDAAKCKEEFERLRKQDYFTNRAMWEWTSLIDGKLALATAIEQGAHHNG